MDYQAADGLTGLDFEEAAIEDGFQELSFDTETLQSSDPFMDEFKGLPQAEDEVGGVRQNPFLRVAYGRKLLDYEQERELGKRLAASRREMTEALAPFSACINHLCIEWERAVVNERSPGEVLQWPAGAPTRGDDAADDSAEDATSTREFMAVLGADVARWAEQHGATSPLEAPAALRERFVIAAPAFSMLCELFDVAGASLEAAPQRAKGRARLERALSRSSAARHRFQEARRVMLESNLRLVFSIAGKFVNNGIGYDDLVQEGSIGLLRAIEKFEPALGFKFSTYASTWIWQAVTRAIANQRRTVRVPAHIHDKMIRVRGLAAQIHQRTGREPDELELAQAAGLSVDVVKRALNAANRAVSLDAPVRAGEDSSFIELTADSAQGDAADEVMDSELADVVKREMSRLPQREAAILSLRLGIGGTEAHTLEEIGAIMGITRERTRQLQNRALDTLRARLKGMGEALI